MYYKKTLKKPEIIFSIKSVVSTRISIFLKDYFLLIVWKISETLSIYSAFSLFQTVEIAWKLVAFPTSVSLAHYISHITHSSTLAHTSYHAIIKLLSFQLLNGKSEFWKYCEEQRKSSIKSSHLVSCELTFPSYCYVTFVFELKIHLSNPWYITFNKNNNLLPFTMISSFIVLFGAIFQAHSISGVGSVTPVVMWHGMGMKISIFYDLWFDKKPFFET